LRPPGRTRVEQTRLHSLLSEADGFEILLRLEVVSQRPVLQGPIIRYVEDVVEGREPVSGTSERPPVIRWVGQILEKTEVVVNACDRRGVVDTGIGEQRVVVET